MLKFITRQERNSRASHDQELDSRFPPTGWLSVLAICVLKCDYAMNYAVTLFGVRRIAFFATTTIRKS